MKTGKTWQQTAERLAESGWAWRHREIMDRNNRKIHVAAARNDDGERHAVSAESVAPAFAALEQSIRSVNQTE